MSTIKILYGNNIISSQEFTTEQPVNINAMTGDHFVIEGLQADALSCQRVNDDLQFWQENQDQTLLVLKDYYQFPIPPAVQINNEALALQLLTPSQTFETVESTLPIIAGGEGAGEGSPALVWGFGEITTEDYSSSFLPPDAENITHLTVFEEINMQAIDLGADQPSDGETHLNYGDDWLMMDHYSNQEASSLTIGVHELLQQNAHPLLTAHTTEQTTETVHTVPAEQQPFNGSFVVADSLLLQSEGVVIL